MRYALVDPSNVVVNIIEYDPEGGYVPPSGHTLVQATTDTQVGGTWNGSAFTAAPTPSPDPLAADIRRCRDYYTSAPLDSYLANDAPTNAQTLAVIKETVRTLRSLIRIARGM